MKNRVPIQFIWSSIRGIFLNIYMYHFVNIFYKMYMFGSDRAIMKGTLLVEESIFLAGSHLPFEGFS